MSHERGIYPDVIWDGLSKNASRKTRHDQIEPNPQDWNKLTSELIALQEHVTFITDRLSQRFFETLPLSRDERIGGLILTTLGIRNIAVSGGILWEKLNRHIISAIDTSISDSFDTFHDDGSGGFIQTIGITQWPDTDFDDGSGILATLGKKKFGVLWFYITISNDLIMIYGKKEHKDPQKIQLEPAPINLPNQIRDGGRLISRLIFKKSSDTPDLITSAFAQI